MNSKKTCIFNNECFCLFDFFNTFVSCMSFYCANSEILFLYNKENILYREK